MRVVVPGHLYRLDYLDSDQGVGGKLRFVHRIGEKFPGNIPPAFAGTTTQEVLRTLVDRMTYVNRQSPGSINDAVIFRLRECVALLELRAAEIRRDPEAVAKIYDSLDKIEAVPTCPRCGHLFCREH